MHRFLISQIFDALGNELNLKSLVQGQGNFFGCVCIFVVYTVCSVFMDLRQPPLQFVVR